MKKLTIVQRKLSKSLKLRGVLGTLGYVSRMSFLSFSKTKRSEDLTRKSKKIDGMAFDEMYGVDTSGIVSLSSLNVDSSNWIHGVHYETINSLNFSEMLTRYDIDFEHFIFVDIGSGKGKPLLLAASLPFKRIIGVELCRELHSIAVDNVRKYPDELKQCKDILSLNSDAATFELPDDNLVIYLYNPFEIKVMKEVVENVQRSFKENPRRIVVIYFNPRFSRVWEELDFLLPADEITGGKIFDTRKECLP